MNQPGGVFHPYPFISTILDFTTIIVIYQINLHYTKQSIRSTIHENHKKQESFNNSVIIKRFMFEFINRFMHLWYIAFIEFDTQVLQVLLCKMFIMDEIRKVITETLIPLLMKNLQEKNKIELKQDLMKKEDFQEEIVNKLIELNTFEYDQFDDYIEVLFQYGYITLFSSIFVWAAPLALLFNIIEIKSDRFKLGQKLYQRNTPHKVTGIGMWCSLFLTLNIASIYSNFIFIFFSYNKLWLVVILFLIEHIILIIKYSIVQYVQITPKWVRILIRRMKLLGKI